MYQLTPLELRLLMFFRMLNNAEQTALMVLADSFASHPTSDPAPQPLPIKVVRPTH